MKNASISTKASGTKRGRSVIALALHDYLKQQLVSTSDVALPQRADQSFARSAALMIYILSTFCELGLVKLWT
jgi:hypothetical protein